MPVHILVPMDDSPMATRALEHALSMHPDARVTVLHVIDYIEESYSTRALVGPEKLKERGRERSEELFERAERIADDHDIDIETESVVGDPSRQIVDYADEHDVDQIVMGCHGRSPMSRVLLGSVAETVSRRAPVPVTIVR